MSGLTKKPVMGANAPITLGKKVGEITKVRFKNGIVYEIVRYDKREIFGFRDCPFRHAIDEDWTHHVWSTSDLKKYLEQWWKTNAPDELVHNFKVTIPSLGEVFGNEVPWQKAAKGEKQFEYFKDWHHRIKTVLTDEDHKEGWSWWLRSPYAGNTSSFCYVSTYGSADYSNAVNSYGVSPCFLKRK